MLNFRMCEVNFLPCLFFCLQLLLCLAGALSLSLSFSLPLALQLDSLLLHSLLLLINSLLLLLAQLGFTCPKLMGQHGSNNPSGTGKLCCL